MISLENILKEILPIYSRYMVCYTLDEQNEIINEFLGVIDINDKRRLIKDEIDMCKICKFNPRNLNIYRILPSTIAKDICKYNCKNKLKTIVDFVDKDNVNKIEKVIDVLNEKENTKIDGSGFYNDINNSKFIYVNLLEFPTFKKIQKKLNDDEKKVYDIDLHQRLKTYYRNLWQENRDIDDKRNYMDSYYDGLRNVYIAEFKNNRLTTRNQMYDFVKQKFQFLKSILEKVFDIISKDKFNSNDLLKQLCSDVNLVVKNCLTSTSRGYDCNDFRIYLDRRCPYLTKEEYTRIRREENAILNREYLNSAKDFE